MNSHESALLAAILDRPSLIDSLEITPGLFQDSDARAILSAVESCRNNQIASDLIAIGDALGIAGRSEAVQTAAGLSGTGMPVSAPYHTEQLREAARRRGLEAVLRDGISALADLSRPTREVLESIESGALEAFRQAPETEPRRTADLIPDWLRAVEGRKRDREAGRVDGIGTGISALDGILGPMRPGSVNIIAGRPGSGKTALSLGIALHAAVDEGLPSAVFSLEMTRAEQLDRIAAARSRFTLGKIRGGYLQDYDWTDLLAVGNRLASAPLAIFDGPHGLGTLRSRIRRETARGCRLVIVDYLGLLDLGVGGRIPRWERIGEVSRDLKLLALNLRIVIVLAVQLNREAEGKPPTLADLRDSGSIEQDADSVLLLHVTGEGDPRPVQANIAKNRHGPTGKTELSFDGPHVRFIDPASPIPTDTLDLETPNQPGQHPHREARR